MKNNSYFNIKNELKILSYQLKRLISLVTLNWKYLEEKKERMKKL